MIFVSVHGVENLHCQLWKSLAVTISANEVVERFLSIIVVFQ